ncbi:acyl carrier protein [Chelativorans intermedius]|uniref:Acyl carrier protein n=1 Tax=Chelativorans intermedius TaxID=515947 RepID=A0ABV6DBE8_9HYPH|nr:acyl carrier protein [Chelativorans intermedius]MCT8999189.1 acyl carrier protein [Chelativorans intermedius]
MGEHGQHREDTLGESILARIRAHAGEGSSGVELSTRLEDLGIHSLELTEIIFDLEEEFGIEIDMNTADAWENLNTVSDIVDAVRALVAAKT